MQRESVADATYAAVLLTVCGVLAVATGQPLVFPSLGPTAYLLARTSVEGTQQLDARRVVGGHAVGLAAGALSYQLLASGLAVTAGEPPLSPDSLRLAVAAVLALGLTTAGMVRLRAEHAPACATTLIVALGLLTTPLQLAGVLGSVVLLFASHRSVRRLVVD